MQHNRRNTELGMRHRSKQALTASSTSARVAKYRLCVASRRGGLQTPSIVASCGLYGGRKSSDSTPRYLRRSGASIKAWWYLALSNTTTMRWPCARCRSSFLRKASKVSALNTAHIARTNLPVRRLTAPKQATDLRVGACCNTGSLISAGTHMRQREPCCWKWHSSRLHSSTSARLARRRSFFYRRHFHRVGLRHLRSRLAQAKAELPEQALTLPHSQLNAETPAQVLRQQRPVPPIGCQAERPRGPAQIRCHLPPLTAIKLARPPGPLALAQALQAAVLESPDPTLHRAGILAEQSGNFPTRLPRRYQEQPMQAMIVTRLLAATDLLLYGYLHHLRVLDLQFAHRRSPVSRRCNHTIRMQHYLCRYV